VKLGDLVSIRECSDTVDCECFFCHHSSSRIGLVTGPAEYNQWHVMFDCGEWELSDGEAEVIYEGR